MAKKRQTFSVGPVRKAAAKPEPPANPWERFCPTVEECKEQGRVDLLTWRGEYLTAHEIVDEHGGLDAAAVTEVAENAQACLTGYVATVPEKVKAPPVACREGCAWCCSLPVSVWPLELFALASWLHEHRTQEELAGLAERLRAAVAEGDRQRAAAPASVRRVPCALLQGERCGVYPVRPAACVGWNSLDAVPCEAYAKGDDEAKCDVDPLRMFTARAVPEAAAAALMRRGGPRFDADHCGPGGTVDLPAGLLAVIERGPGAVEEWLAGGGFLAEAARRVDSMPAHERERYERHLRGEGEA